MSTQTPDQESENEKPEDSQASVEETIEEKIEFYLNTKIPFGEYAKCEE